MKQLNPKLLLTLLAIFLVSFQAVGQSAAQRAKIASKNNVEKLNQLQNQLRSRLAANYEKALRLAQEKGWPIQQQLKDGTTIVLYGVDKFNLPLYLESTNLNAARTTSTVDVQPGGESGLALTGDGLTVGMWEVSRPRLTHQEFDGRVTQVESSGNPPVDLHSTHVAGTLIASGVNPNALGMAPEGLVDAYTASGDVAEMAAAAADGLLISNHSYGFITGWRYNYFGDGRYAWFGSAEISETEDYRFGAYTESTQEWDEIAANAPGYLIVKSAGNDRLEGPSPGAEHWFFNPEIGDWELSTAVRDLDGGPDGYDAIGEQATAKNIMSVGAVNDIVNGYTNPGDVQMSSFSSWGPTDDGRIKPDIVANGVSLTSSSNASNTAYSSISGTSMASPNAAGSLLLLQEHYEETTGSFMTAATLKGLAIHSTDEAGTTPGPDYSFGHGLLNTAKAAEVISNNDVSSFIREEVLADGETFTFDVEWDGSQPLVATISWTDAPSSVLTNDVDDPTLRLVNDLDLRVSRDGEEYSPWILDPADPSAAATVGDNFRDNVEKLFIADTEPGTYTVTVTHKGSLDGGAQPFSLIISGENISTAPAIAVTPEAILKTLEAGETGTETITISNEGTADLDWSISIEGADDMRFSELVSSTRGHIANGTPLSGTTATNVQRASTDAISGGVLALENVVQYATDFEEFSLGELDEQQGWSSTEGAYFISDENPASGEQHIRGISDTPTGQTLAFSPLVEIGNEATSSMSANVNLTGSGSTWEIIPQSPAAGSVNTRIAFEADGSLTILDADANDYVAVDAEIPSGYFELTYTVNRNTFAQSLYFDGTLVYEGTGFSGDIEQVVLLSLSEGNTILDFDDLQIVDGDLMALDWLSAETTSGTVAPGESEDVELFFDATALTAATYDAVVSVFSNDFTNPQVDIPVTLTVTQDGVEPVIAVEPDSLSEELNMGEVSSQELMVHNNGTGILNFDVEILQEGDTSFAEKVALSSVAVENIKNVKPFRAVERNTIPERFLNGTSAITEGIALLSTTLYATGFEDFNTGDINGQQGWYGAYGNWTIETDNPATGEQHFRGLSDGLGQSLAISPTVAIGEEEYSSMSAMIDITGSNVSWNIAPQSPTAELVVTRVYFEPDGSIAVLEDDGAGGAVVVPVDATIPEDYFEVAIEVNRSTFEYTVYIDQAAIHTGPGFAGDIENVAIVSLMEEEGPILDMDNFSIYDGRIESEEPLFWLTVAPSEGSVNPGDSETLIVNFDASALEAGGYNAEIIINSNDPNNSTVSVPVSLTVGEGGGNPLLTVEPDSLSAQLEEGETSTQPLTLGNEGNEDLVFEVEVLTEGMTSFAEMVESSRAAVANISAVKALREVPRGAIPESLMKGTTALTEGISLLSTNLYATDFEDFNTGDINGQQGWYGAYGNWTIETENPATGDQHFRGLSDGLGQSLAISPTVGQGEEAYSSMSAMFDVTGTGVSWNVAPQSPTAELVVTRVYFEADGSMAVLVPDPVEEAIVVPIDATVPEGYFELSIEVERSTFDFSVFLDGEEVYSGTGFAGDIENVAIVSSMEVEGPTLDMDNFAIIDGQLDGGTEPLTWLTVTPTAGEIAPGEETELEVEFDATGLEEGEYYAEILINSNDESNPTVIVPVSLTVGEGDDGELITQFMLIDADNDAIIGELEDGDVLDLADLSTDNLNLIALTDSTEEVSSVMFTLSSGNHSRSRTDNYAPYSLFGDRGGDFFGVSPIERTYTLTAVPYVDGVAGEEKTITFEVTDSEAGETKVVAYPNPVVNELNLNLSNKHNGIVRVTLLDHLGRKHVLGTEKVGSGNKTLSYDLTGLNLRSGKDYYVKIESKNNKPEVIRIVKR